MMAPRRAKLCLKARPTPVQLADRLRPVDGTWPDGVELYLAAEDLATPAVVDAIAKRVLEAEVPDDFVWLIEGPVDSLDGGDFDITRESDADVLVIRRLATLAARIKAGAVNIHVISPSPDLSRLTLECRTALLARAVPFLARFVDLMRDAGTVPTVENMPPVLRMRRDDFSFTPIGIASADLRWLVERLPGLRLLADTSHAGLYLNARRLKPDPAYAWSAPLAQYLRQLPAEAHGTAEGAAAHQASRTAAGQAVPADTGVAGQADHTDAGLVGYLDSLLPHVENAQISNAAGVLGEGLAYAEGEFELDPAIRWLGQHAQHIVTEPIEANNDDALAMRDALRRMRLALS
jgi:hypothetical protein